MARLVIASISLVLLALVAAKPFRNLGGTDPEENMTGPEVIRYWGYPAEVHHVTTADGYILELHRIPKGKDVEATKGPIFIQHGVLSSSAAWVINIGHENLGFLLADAGYDVWMGNIRGNAYSRKHTVLDPDTDSEFWQFSWAEMAKYDMPAQINYALEQTKVEKIPLIGHSMGTSMTFALLSESEEFNQKISAFFAMAPVAYAHHMTSPVIKLAPFVNIEDAIAKLFGINEVLQDSEIIKFFGDSVCKDAPQLVCENLLFAICGYGYAETNATRLPVIMHHAPEGTSVQTLVHYAQLVNAKKFQHFDYGAIKNLQVYGQLTPPEYPVEKITTPVAIFWSDNDYFGDKDDVALLAPRLQNLKADYRVPESEFTHLDFMWGINATPLVYNKILELLPVLTSQ